MRSSSSSGQTQATQRSGGAQGTTPPLTWRWTFALVWRGCLRSTETGKELWQGGEFREVAPPYCLTFTFAWDEEGERGLETLVTVAFAEQDGKTLMTFRHALFQSIGERDGHQGGWTSTFDRLADYLREL